MSSWKRDVDRQLERERAQDQRDRVESQHKEEEEDRRKLEDHRRRFRCKYCQEPSVGPKLNFRYDDATGKTETIKVWDTPGRLGHCSNCNEYFCPEHLKDGKCIRCWGKG